MLKSHLGTTFLWLLHVSNSGNPTVPTVRVRQQQSPARGQQTKVGERCTEAGNEQTLVETNRKGTQTPLCKERVSSASSRASHREWLPFLPGFLIHSAGAHNFFSFCCCLGSAVVKQSISESATGPLTCPAYSFYPIWNLAHALCHSMKTIFLMVLSLNSPNLLTIPCYKI